MNLSGKSRFQDLKRRRIMKRDFDGKTLISECGNNYRIEQGCFIFENKSAEIDLISALDESFYLLFLSSRPDVTSHTFKERLDYWIITSYHAPIIGDYVAVTFTDEYAKRNQRYGYITSRITKVQRTQ